MTCVVQPKVGAGEWLQWNETLSRGGVGLEEVGKLRCLAFSWLEPLQVEDLIDLVWTEEGGRPPALYKEVVVQEIR